MPLRRIVLLLKLLPQISAHPRWRLATQCHHSCYPTSADNSSRLTTCRSSDRSRSRSTGDELVRLLTSYGRNLPDFHGNDAWMLPIPATFVRKDGIVAARFRDADFRKREAVENLVAALQLINGDQSTLRSIFVTVDAGAVRCRPATPLR